MRTEAAIVSNDPTEERQRLVASLVMPVVPVAALLGLFATGSLPSDLIGLALGTVAVLAALSTFVLVRIVHDRP